MTDTVRLRKVIESKGLKYSYLAKKLSLTTYGLQKKIENDTEFKASEIACLCDILGLDNYERDLIFFNRSVDSKSTNSKVE